MLYKFTIVKIDGQSEAHFSIFSVALSTVHEALHCIPKLLLKKFLYISISMNLDIQKEHMKYCMCFRLSAGVIEPNQICPYFFIILKSKFKVIFLPYF